MKQVLLFVLGVLIVSGCGAASVNAQEPEVRATSLLNLNYTPLPTMTMTVTPTATVDWQGTAMVAQATADEARRLDTQATAQEKDRVQVQLGWTAAANQWTAQADQWTATAALTSVPLTATQQAVVNTQVPIQQALEAGHLTATKEAPAQAKAMVDAKNYEKYGAADYVVRLLVLGALGVFLLGVGLFALAARPKANAEAGSVEPTRVEREPDLVPLKQEKETVITVKTNNGQGWGQDLSYKLPCSALQLTELAERVLLKGETLGMNNWEGKDSALTRAVVIRVRRFFVDKKLAVETKSGRVNLNDDGFAFLRGWLESKTLPHSYSFAPVESAAPLNMSHVSGAHVSAHGGG